jgi:hypothetical protein
MFGFERISGEPHRTRFKFLLNYDIRLGSYVPKKLVEKGSIKSMRQYVEFVRRRAERVDDPAAAEQTETSADRQPFCNITSSCDNQSSS